ncbi:MAG: 2-oxoglutarate dehydrogenase complex dihydrolipoyllysine-residue succinyltransferase [Candidatus Electryonea clarkiae]|nr:2-oxoglutarate dehydrogenase complex dihydrolipoyllysine-residue succinyltransferase [Candidatus Electryonea clarkiae]MDP8288318.1 2-oxoglutarate dehydrogenase complex dihydrolipoyllysine-residue succinyltransferase [Candidatus Electryonea clarkiae]
MIAEIKVPEVGESITEGILVEWKVEDGAYIKIDEEIFELETDKITMNVTSEFNGKISIQADAGSTVHIGQVVGTVDTEAVPQLEEKGSETVESAPIVEAPPINPPAGMPQATAKLEKLADENLSPAARRIVLENNINPALITGTGKDGRITKSDVLTFIADKTIIDKPPVIIASPGDSNASETRTSMPKPISLKPGSEKRQTREPMSSLRIRIAERLVQSQQTAAILTTFNEVDMTELMAVRAKFKDAYTQKFGIKLGMMSFFVKATVDALITVPKLNAQIDGNDIVHNHFYDIGVAVSTEKGLVVPVIRDADKLSFAEIELVIADYSRRAKERSLTLDDLSGGVFTISNGGIFGSLLSTPILNPPQSGILGMHGIKKRPVVVGENDQIEARPMMYLAVSYDHRIVDGSEAVVFLKRIVECIENPERIMLEI